MLLPVAPRMPFRATGAFAVKTVLFDIVVPPLKASEPSPVMVGLPFRTREFGKV